MSGPALPWSKGGYYYAYLSSSHEQECYSLIYGKLIEDEFDVVLPCKLSSEEITRIINALKYDKPELSGWTSATPMLDPPHCGLKRFTAEQRLSAAKRQH